MRTTEGTNQHAQQSTDSQSSRPKNGSQRQSDVSTKKGADRAGTTEVQESVNGHEQRALGVPALEPRIYIVAAVAAGSGSRGLGVWLEAAREPAAIRADIEQLTQRLPDGPLPSPTPPIETPFAIRDYRSFGCYQVGPGDSIELVSAVARGIQEHGYAFAAWAQEHSLPASQRSWLRRKESRDDVHSSDPDLLGWLDCFDAYYLGHYDSPEAYVQHQLDEITQQLGWLVEDSPTLHELASYVTIDRPALTDTLRRQGDYFVYRADPEQGGGVWLFKE